MTEKIVARPREEIKGKKGRNNPVEIEYKASLRETVVKNREITPP